MGQAVFAFSRERWTGIDLEIPRDQDVDYQGIISYFSPAEQEHLRAVSAEGLTDEFLRFWTGKEAVLKAIGTGLSEELSSLEIEASSTGLRTVLVQKSADKAADWRLFELAPYDRGRCTLATRQPSEIACTRLTLDAGFLERVL